MLHKYISPDDAKVRKQAIIYVYYSHILRKKDKTIEIKKK